jgi:hypothetical protein
MQALAEIAITHVSSPRFLPRCARHRLGPRASANICDGASIVVTSDRPVKPTDRAHRLDPDGSAPVDDLIEQELRWRIEQSES